MKFRFDDFKRIFLPLLIIFLLLLWLTPRSSRFNYDYRKGTAWEYDDLVAEFDFPILKTESEMQAERLQQDDKTVPYFKFSAEAEQEHLDQLRQRLSFPIIPSMREDILRLVSAVFDRGVIADEYGDRVAASSVIYVEREKQRQTVASGRDAKKDASGNVFTVSQARSYISRQYALNHGGYPLDSLFAAMQIADVVVPNLFYDEVMTELVDNEKSRVVSPTRGIVHFGDRIVQRGELITDDVMRVLDSYRQEYESRLGGLAAGRLALVGHIIMVLAVVLLFYLTILYSNPLILKEANRFHYLCLIFTFASSAALIIERVNPHFLYMVPFTLTTLFLVAFFKKRVVLPVYVVSLLPLLLFAHNGQELFFMFLVSGVVTIYVFDYFNRGWQQFLTALIAFLTVSLVYFGFRFFLGDEQNLLQILLMLFIGSFLSVAGYPLIYLFEILFNLVSSSRLLELCDTNNKLLRELAEKAPGTFQHSLQVMNMADAACREIDADVLLVRAGALYHDIGKMRNPRCFIENEGQFPGMKPYHEGLSPHDSAVQIVRHVPDGLELAEKHHLPYVVKEFIRTHHGTSVARYFYTQYLNAGGDPANAPDFSYDGAKPVTREQTILMLCDSVEAASRTMKDYSQEACTELVRKIVQGKITDGQLEQSELSIKDLDNVQSFLARFLSQMYHGRIEYPTLNKTASRNLSRGRWLGNSR